MQLNAAIAKLRTIPALFDKPEVRERILRPAAEILQREAQAKVRVAQRAVKRYGTAKFSRRIKAAKGSGTVLATYEPGNLRMALQVLNFKRSKALFVGAKVMKRKPNGTFGKGKRADGWYAHFLEYGTKNAKAYPFMRPAAMAKANAVKLRMKYGIELEMKRWQAKNATT